MRASSGGDGVAGGQAGWFCAYTPLEVLSAAGLEPVRLLGVEGPTPDADSVLGTNICPYVRACLEQGLAGDAPPAVVFAGCCDGMRRLRDAWERYCDPELSCAFDVPRSTAPEAVSLFRGAIHRLLDELGRYTGRRVTASGLAEAARERSEMESRLAAAADGMRAGDRRARDVMRLFMDSQAAALDGAGEDAAPGERPGGGSAGARSEGQAEAPGRPRVALTGNLLRREGMISALDSLGAGVVMLDLCSAERSLIWEEGAEGLEGKSLEELVGLLVEHYLGKLACPRMLDAERRHDRLVEGVRASGARGVIAIPLMFCDPFLFDIPRLENRLEREGIPALVMASDYQDENAGQVLTRLEAFLEMI